MDAVENPLILYVIHYCQNSVDSKRIIMCYMNLKLKLALILWNEDPKSREAKTKNSFST
jgi:hypothetical protein